MSEIEQIVNEYNQTEAEQRKRLIRLYELMDARKGYRRVQFGPSRNWSNCWNEERRDLAIKRHVEPLVLEITAVDPGDE